MSPRVLVSKYFIGRFYTLDQVTWISLILLRGSLASQKKIVKFSIVVATFVLTVYYTASSKKNRRLGAAFFICQPPEVLFVYYLYAAKGCCFFRKRCF